VVLCFSPCTLPHSKKPWKKTLSGCIFAAEACIDNRKKNLLNIDTFPTCPHNMVNFGLLAAEILWPVWGTPANFNGFHVLAALLHGTLVVGVTKFCGVEQRAPPIFGRATITLGIGPHSSFVLFLYSQLCNILTVFIYGRPV